TALANRADIAANKITFSNNQISALGTANGILPQLAGIAGATNNGLNGEPKPAVVPPEQLAQFGKGPLPSAFGPCPPGVGHQGSICQFPDPYFLGNIGVGLGQVVRRNFPSERVGAFIAPILRNRQAQADYAIDQLGLRQTELENLRTTNQVGVDVSNQVVGLQQSRVRYMAAVKNRVLQEQLLDAEQKRFSLGASTTFLVVQQQRDLALAQSTEIAALVAYSNARVALDQVLGTTLETSHITIEEAKNGHVNRPSVLPATLPTQP
ncbi:MAG: TolC family protein, partial [Acidobacteria bacterium]|nr:TolC family protein [Acidobacteriota bacterium]